MPLITVFYYIMAGIVAIMMIWNFIKERDIQKEILIIMAIIPFLLRLFRLK